MGHFIQYTTETQHQTTWVCNVKVTRGVMVACVHRQNGGRGLVVWIEIVWIVWKPSH